MGFGIRLISNNINLLMDTYVKDVVEIKNEDGGYIIEDDLRFELNEFLNQFPIRVIGTHIQPYFYASDICKILNLVHTYKAVEGFTQDEVVSYNDRIKKDIKTYRWNGSEHHNILLLTEYGVYRMFAKHNSEQTDIFRRWMYKVIHAVRITGSYVSERDKVVPLKIRNEQQLKLNGTLRESNMILKNRLNAFENLTEYICLFERDNDDPQEIFSTFMVPKPDRWDDDDNDMDDPDDDCDYIHDWHIFSQKYPEEVKKRSKYYKLTTKPTVKDWAYYSLIARVYVRDCDAMLLKITRRIREFAVGKNVFMCKGDEIINAFNVVFKNPLITRDFDLTPEQSSLNNMKLKLPKRHHPKIRLCYNIGYEYNNVGKMDESTNAAVICDQNDDDIPTYMVDFSSGSSQKIIKNVSSITIDDVDEWIDNNLINNH